MNILKITDPAFRKYGKIITNIDFSQLVEALADTPALSVPEKCGLIKEAFSALTEEVRNLLTKTASYLDLTVEMPCKLTITRNPQKVPVALEIP